VNQREEQSQIQSTINHFRLNYKLQQGYTSSTQAEKLSLPHGNIHESQSAGVLSQNNKNSVAAQILLDLTVYVNRQYRMFCKHQPERL
jgi:hypothetical protein